MKRTNIKFALMIVITAIGVAFLGCKGKESDPETLTKDALNPPGYAFTVTKSAELELRWPTANAEKEFKGYYVFGSTKTLTDLKDLVAYPVGAKDKLGEIGIPRCAENSKFFEAFGFKATTVKCEGGEPEKLALADETTTATEEKLENYLQCGTNTDSKPSVPATTGVSLEIQKCLVKKAYDPTTAAQVALVNGTAYTFIVLAVKGDKYTDVSWTSNVVEDAPSSTAYTGSIELDEEEYTTLTFTFSSASAVTAEFPATALSCPTSNASTDIICAPFSGNTTSVTEPTLFFGRAPAGASYEQRLFVSASSAQSGTEGTIKIQHRGPQTLDAKTLGGDDSKQARIPDDAPVTTDYPDAGPKEIVYNNTVYDIEIIKSSTEKYYGKIVIGDIDYAGDAKTGKATIAITVVVQPGKNLVYYLQ